MTNTNTERFECCLNFCRERAAVYSPFCWYHVEFARYSPFQVPEAT